MKNLTLVDNFKGHAIYRDEEGTLYVYLGTGWLPSYCAECEYNHGCYDGLYPVEDYYKGSDDLRFHFCGEGDGPFSISDFEFIDSARVKEAVDYICCGILTDNYNQTDDDDEDYSF